uniref:Uncharacterized protein n=1 Tax=Oryza glumipatula TaxID=40148 RepID=A0A0E0BMW6_9ORYZ
MGEYGKIIYEKINARELIRTINDAGVALGTPPGLQQESSVLRNALQLLELVTMQYCPKHHRSPAKLKS